MDEFYKVYRWVLEAKELSSHEKLAYSIISGLSAQEGYCTAGDDYFCKLLNMSKRRVREIIYALEEKGYIIRETFFQKRKIYPVEKQYIHPKTP